VKTSAGKDLYKVDGLAPNLLKAMRAAVSVAGSASSGLAGPASSGLSGFGFGGISGARLRQADRAFTVFYSHSCPSLGDCGQGAFGVDRTGRCPFQVIFSS